MRLLNGFIGGFLLALPASASGSEPKLNFAFEQTQLSERDAAGFAAIAFGDTSSPSGRPAAYTGPRCRVGPEDAAWPTGEEWAQLNATVGGRLLKPAPAPAVCYPGPRFDRQACDFLASGAARQTRFWLDDPLSVLSPWTQGNTCPAVANLTDETKTCSQGGFPTYEVNASSVRDVQAAVNFARNKHLRLVIK